jgi:hypothetical protein
MHVVTDEDDRHLEIPPALGSIKASLTMRSVMMDPSVCF